MADPDTDQIDVLESELDDIEAAMNLVHGGELDRADELITTIENTPTSEPAAAVSESVGEGDESE